MLALWWPAQKQKSACQAVPIQKDHLASAGLSIPFARQRISSYPRPSTIQTRPNQNPSLSKGTQPNAAAMPGGLLKKSWEVQ